MRETWLQIVLLVLLFWLIAVVPVFITAALGHDIYTGLKNRLGYDCCGGVHCEPLSGDQVVPTSVQGFPGYRIMGQYFIGESNALPSPDGRFHICWSQPVHDPRYNRGGIINCFFVPFVGY